MRSNEEEEEENEGGIEGKKDSLVCGVYAFVGG
jgi:hypothetical protein